ncbi:TPA: HNH endonuclease [Klebsiella variicola]|uniref:HNH endonuclease signature motif containing protein n=1 Tax=Klebsiella pneumoniae TaxID=573 RepID=UPI0029862A0D|nr:HNH endonuclease [Klebsiella pneumoniae]HCI8535342.1 HNH endonuclease [Klebsiella variicola]HCI8642941.1 HNH endonuclease [Klebsiella variicola]HCI8781685.1 HNH endonuclease [Klebsiella variicola]HCI8988432.1 HNH endonuclease [Klebsiella variicola]
MFYPKLTRRKNYSIKKGGGYYRYSYYKDEILTDCQKRCVYCDLLLEEHAYEGMHLDHFRPQVYFKTITNDPNNLVISCPKCNILKSNHWPCDKLLASTPSHNGKVGFVDPFMESFSDYFLVGDDGVLEPLKDPAAYMLTVFDLNRQARVLSRKKRIQLNIMLNLFKKLDDKTDELFQLMVKKEISEDLAEEKYKAIITIRESLRELLK